MNRAEQIMKDIADMSRTIFGMAEPTSDEGQMVTRIRKGDNGQYGVVWSKNASGFFQPVLCGISYGQMPDNELRPAYQEQLKLNGSGLVYSLSVGGAETTILLNEQEIETMRPMREVREEFGLVTKWFGICHVRQQPAFDKRLLEGIDHMLKGQQPELYLATGIKKVAIPGVK